MSEGEIGNMSNEVKLLAEPYTSNRKLPSNFQKKDERVFENELSKEIPRAAIVELKDSLFVAEGLVFVKRKIHPDTLRYKPVRGQLEFRVWLKAKLSYKKVEMADKAIVLHNYYWNGYFHWMTEVLPKLLAVKELEDDVCLVLPELRAAYQRTTFEAFEFENFTFLKERTYIKPKNLLSVENFAPAGNFNNEYICRLADFLKSRFAIPLDRKEERKIYISRKKALKRKVLNEAELETALKGLGYEILCMEDYTFAEQIAICSQSKVMVALHGAGLTNMMFMPKSSVVYELRFEHDFHNNCYFTLSSEFNHDYYYQLCSAEQEGQETHAGNVIINQAEFHQNLQMIEQSL